MTQPCDVDKFYEVLGVAPSASPEAIRSAYRIESKKWHPDVNSDSAATARMALINEAFSVLSDPVRRFEYDRKQPPMPVISCSTHDASLGQKTKKIVVTVTSNRTIGNIDFPTPYGVGWTATVQVIDATSFVIEVTKEKSGAVGVSYLDFSVDGCKQSIRVDVIGAKARKAVAAKSGAVGAALAGMNSFAGLFLVVTCFGGIGLFVGLSGSQSINLWSQMQVRDSQTSLQMLKLLGYVVALCVLYLFNVHVVNGHWSLNRQLRQTLAIASYVVCLNAVWPIGLSWLLLALFVIWALRTWVRL